MVISLGIRLSLRSTTSRIVRSSTNFLFSVLFSVWQGAGVRTVLGLGSGPATPLGRVAGTTQGAPAKLT